MREVDRLKEHISHERKLRLQAETQAGLGRSAKRKSIVAGQQVEQLVQENESLRSQCLSLSEQLIKAHDEREKLVDQQLQQMQQLVQENDCLRSQMAFLSKSQEKVTRDHEARVAAVRTDAQTQVQTHFADFQNALEALKAAKAHTFRNEKHVVLGKKSPWAAKLKSCSCKEEALDLGDIAQTRILAARVVQNAVVHGLVHSMALAREEAAQDSPGQSNQLANISRSTGVGTPSLSAALKTALDKIQQLRNSLNERCSEYSDNLAAREAELGLLRQELCRSREDAASSKAAVSRVQEEARQIHFNLEAKASSLEEELQTSLQDAACSKMESVELYRAMEAAREEFRCTQKKLEEQALSYSKSLAAREAQVCALTSELHRTHQQVASLTDECSNLSSTLEWRTHPRLQRAPRCTNSRFDSPNAEGGVQAVHERNRELLHTVEQLTRDCQMVNADNRCLRRAASLLTYGEGRLEEAFDLDEESLRVTPKSCTSESSTVRSLVEALPSLAHLLQAGTSEQKSSMPEEEMCSATSVSSAPRRLETVRTKLCRETDLVLEGVMQDFCHAKLLMERAIEDCDDAPCQDFSALLSRLRAIGADRRKCDTVNEYGS